MEGSTAAWTSDSRKPKTYCCTRCIIGQRPAAVILRVRLRRSSAEATGCWIVGAPSKSTERARQTLLNGFRLRLGSACIDDRVAPRTWVVRSANRRDHVPSNIDRRARVDWTRWISAVPEGSGIDAWTAFALTAALVIASKGMTSWVA